MLRAARLDQGLARRGRGGAQVFAGVGQRATPERPDVERAEVGVAHRQPHRARWHAQLLCDQDRQSRAIVLADVDLAGEGCHDAVLTDVQPRAATLGATCAGSARAAAWSEDQHEPVAEQLEVLAFLGGHPVPRCVRSEIPEGRRSRRVEPIRARLRCALTHRCARAVHGLLDPAVGTAATHVALQCQADLGTRGSRVLGEQAGGRDDHARRAVATLDRADGEKCLLDRV